MSRENRLIPVYIKYRLMKKKLVLSKDYESTFFGQIGYATSSETGNDFEVFLPRLRRLPSDMQNDSLSIRANFYRHSNVITGLDKNDFKEIVPVYTFLYTLSNFGNSSGKIYMIYSKDDNISYVSSLSTASGVNQQNNNVYVGEIQKVGENIKIINIMTNEKFNISDIEILVIFNESGVVTMNDNVIIEFSPIKSCINRNHLFLFKDSNVGY